MSTKTATTIILTTTLLLAWACPDARADNLALGAKYTLSPAPSYGLSTDPGDKVQLTDGESTTEYFWTQPGTVGWQSVQFATVTVDLEEVKSVGGVSFTTAAGVAGVRWPAAIHVLTSDDGNSWREAGELVRLDRKTGGPWPEGYAIRKLITRELATRARFVQFVVIPLPGGPYTFVDEVEVFSGPEELLEKPPAGRVVGSAEEVYQEGRLDRSLRLRLERDAASLKKAIDVAELPDVSIKRDLLARLGELSKALSPPKVENAATFRATLPFAGDHTKLFALQADLWRAQRHAPLSAYVPPTWEPIDPFAPPVVQQRLATVEVNTMRGEYRAAAVNLANSTAEPIRLEVRFEGLPGGATPDYLTVHAVEWTDTAQSVPVAAALPEASRDGDAWVVSVLPGLTRQVWLTFHVTDLDEGKHEGRIVFETDQDQRLQVPVRLVVWPFEFPKETSLWLGGWSYTNSVGARGVTSENRPALLEHLQRRFVNAPWATSAVLRGAEFIEGEPDRVRLDTKAFDDWVALWPNAKKYLVFLAVAHHAGPITTSLGGAKIGSPEFESRVAAWITAWVEHMRSKGLSADQLGLLIHDEPHEGSDVTAFLTWARAIRKAQPDVLIWQDPTYRRPDKAPQELFDACDVLCPNRPMWLANEPLFEPFYLDQKRQGRMLQFYSCSGPARLLDPYSYYRLQAWHCWHVGATGSYFWAFSDNSGSSSWNEYFVRGGPFAPVFLDNQSVTAAKQMEAVRESVEDYEYFVMLRKAVDRAKTSGRTDAAVRKAETLLADAAKTVLAAEGADGLNRSDPKDRTIADRVRLGILEALVDLQ